MIKTTFWKKTNTEQIEKILTLQYIEILIITITMLYTPWIINIITGTTILMKILIILSYNKYKREQNAIEPRNRTKPNENTNSTIQNIINKQEKNT